MNEIGKILKQAREERQLSLAEIEGKIKIRKKYLEALEAENFTVFPGNVYMFGFLRNYASFLNLDSDELVKALKSDLEQEKTETAVTKPKGSTTSYRVVNKNSYNYTKLLKYLLIIIPLILAGIYFFSYFTNEPSSDLVPPKSIMENNKRDPEPPIEQNINGAIESAVEEGIRLLLIVSKELGSRCWVEVKTDGTLNYSGILEQGEEMYFQAEEKINIRLGNAGVVTLIYNDENIGLAGPTDKVVDLEFPKN